MYVQQLAQVFDFDCNQHNFIYDIKDNFFITYSIISNSKKKEKKKKYVYCSRLIFEKNYKP